MPFPEMTITERVIEIWDADPRNLDGTFADGYWNWVDNPTLTINAIRVACDEYQASVESRLTDMAARLATLEAAITP